MILQRTREIFPLFLRPLLFLYQRALVEGENQPCFYCGSKKHLATNCPSKQLTEITPFTEELGYLSFDEINNLFFNYLAGKKSKLDKSSWAGNQTVKSTRLAQNGFYDLKMIYQLRLLRTIWSSGEDSWHRAKEIRYVEDKGGLVWIGQDCLRVSNLYKAESILNDSLKKDPHDYKAHCLLGLLNMERKSYVQAKFYLKNALDFAKTTPEKICILFLMSRFYSMRNDPSNARERIKKILHLTRFCNEALFQDIIFEFKEGKEALALRHLIGFIRKNRDYYVNALIDPELADFSEIIHENLKAMFEEARGEALLFAQKAEEELKNLETMLGEQEKEVIEARSLWKKIEALSKTDSYLGYLDIIQYGGSIIKIGSSYIDERRKKILSTFDKLKHRIEKCQIFLDNYPYKSLSSPVKEQLINTQTTFDQIWGLFQSQFPRQSNEIFSFLEEFTLNLKKIELKLKKLDSTRQVLKFATKFLIKCLIFQAANVIIGIMLFPVLAYYLGFLLPGLDVDPKNVWYYQKMFLILGGVSGLFGAITLASKNISTN
jgi:tetratricopeptide (TPR) repeat protein